MGIFRALEQCSALSAEVVLLVNMSIDRIQVNSALVVATFVAVLLLSSQSAASMVTYLLCLAMLARVAEWNDVFRSPMIWPIVALLVYLPLSSFWSSPFEWRGLMSQLVRAMLTFTFVVALAECQLRGKVQAGLGQILGGSGALVALLTLIWFLVEPPADGRLHGLGQLETPVVAALVFGATALFVVHGMFQSGRWETSAFGIVCLIPLCLAVALSDSRNAWVSLVFGGSVMVLAHLAQNRRHFLLWSVVIGGVLLGGLFAASKLDGLSSDLFPRGDSYRPLIWGEIFKQVQDAPVFGLGILTDDDVVAGPYRFAHPHNLYLSVLFQGGLFGLLLSLWLLLRTLREVWINYNHPDAKLALGTLALALPSYLLDGHELLDKVSDTWFLVWLPIALALGLRWHAGVRNTRLS